MAKYKKPAKALPNKSMNVPASVFQPRVDNKPARETKSLVHIMGKGIVCDTEARGHAHPQGRSTLELVINASEGFIPLWAKEVTLRWRFRERSMDYFAKPAAAMNAIRKLLGEALSAWGDSAPVKFTEDKDVWDFEIVIRRSDDCSANGCVLASAFFPDTGRHELTLYPKLFTIDRKEQVETLVHEIGHVFGLRHFFAKLKETASKSELFGVQDKFSIMNYGVLSTLTDNDKKDLSLLYEQAWSGVLKDINGTPIRLVQPFHTLARQVTDDAFLPLRLTANGQVSTAAAYRKG